MHFDHVVLIVSCRDKCVLKKSGQTVRSESTVRNYAVFVNAF